MVHSVRDEILRHDFTVRRADLIAYADASGDHNPIHLDEAAAKAAGLPNVIAHGMYIMGLAARAVTEWAGGIERVSDFSARFAKPVVVPAGDAGVTVTVSAFVRKECDDGSTDISLTVTCGGVKVLAPARAVIRPAS